MQVILNTDGGCSPNPGFGAWAVILECPELGVGKVMRGCIDNTTNNAMELYAIYEGLKAIKNPENVEVTVRSDSQWAINALSGVYKKVKTNLDIIMQTQTLMTKFKKVDFENVRGHTGDRMNELCDSLVTDARAQKLTRDEFYYEMAKGDGRREEGQERELGTVCPQSQQQDSQAGTSSPA